MEDHNDQLSEVPPMKSHEEMYLEAVNEIYEVHKLLDSIEDLPFTGRLYDRVLALVEKANTRDE